MTITKATATEADFLRDGGALRDAIETCGVGVWRWQLGTDRLEWTGNLEAIHGLPAGSFDGTLASFSSDIHPDDREAVWSRIRNTVETGQPYEVRYRTAPRDGEDTVWIRACGAKVTVGGTDYLTGTCQDFTRQVQGEQELEKRLRHLAGISEFGTFALGENDFQKVLDRAVEVASAIFDAPLTKILQFGDAADALDLTAGIGWKDGLVGTAQVGTDADSQAGHTLRSSAPVIVRDLAAEDRFCGPPLLLEHGVVSGMSVAIEGAGRSFGVFGVHDVRLRDFDEIDTNSLRALANVVTNAWRQHTYIKRHELLTREMAHRANNLLQIVSVIAKQTFAGSADPAVAVASFQQRLVAIARANKLISEDGWSTTRLRTVVEEVLSPYRDQVHVSGRDILLPPDLCFDIALVMHELATNSTKYGSLGAKVAGVSLSWALRTTKDRTSHLELEWHDEVSRYDGVGGTGFGRRLKSALIEGKWGGTMNIDVEDGYRFAVSIPLASESKTQFVRKPNDTAGTRD